jgi:hypothetical protein
MTSAERNLILPVTGLLLYNTSTNRIEYYSGSGWFSFSSPAGFITEWTVSGDVAGSTITLPLNNSNSSSFNCTVNWEDCSSSTVTSYNDPNRIHTYAAAGTYQVEIVGTCEGWSFNNGGDKLKVRKVTHWGTTDKFTGFKNLQNGFYGCSNLSSLAEGGILASGTRCTTSGFLFTFAGCTLLSSIPSNLFDHNTLVSTWGFYITFADCISLTSIPSDLFRNNTAVSSYGFYQTFYQCSGLTSIPTDLFRYNTAVSTLGFYQTFYLCTSLISIPEYLFRDNRVVSTQGFYQTFYGCTSLQLNKWIFYAPGEEGTRFLNRSDDFTQCFYRDSYSGLQGDAPEL